MVCNNLPFTIVKLIIQLSIMELQTVEKRMMYGALCISMTENTGGLGRESTDYRDKFRNRERDCR